MKRKAFWVLLGLLLVGFTAGSSYAEKGQVMKDEAGRPEEGVSHMGGHMRSCGMEMMRPGHRIRMALADLNLDENQKETIREIRTAAKKEAIKKVADVRIARIELRELLDKDLVDMTAVEAKLKQMEALRTELHLSHIKTIEAIKAKLTPEQRQKFKINLKKRSGCHDCWKHERKGHMPQRDKMEKK